MAKDDRIFSFDSGLFDIFHLEKRSDSFPFFHITQFTFQIKRIIFFCHTAQQHHPLVMIVLKVSSEDRPEPAQNRQKVYLDRRISKMRDVTAQIDTQTVADPCLGKWYL